jgi:hypothetical protein
VCLSCLTLRKLWDSVLLAGGRSVAGWQIGGTPIFFRGSPENCEMAAQLRCYAPGWKWFTFRRNKALRYRLCLVRPASRHAMFLPFADKRLLFSFGVQPRFAVQGSVGWLPGIYLCPRQQRLACRICWAKFVHVLPVVLWKRFVPFPGELFVSGHSRRRGRCGICSNSRSGRAARG